MPMNRSGPAAAGAAHGKKNIMSDTTPSTEPTTDTAAAPAPSTCCQGGCACSATRGTDHRTAGLFDRHATTILVAAVVAALVGLLAGFSASGVHSRILCPGPGYMLDAPMGGGWHHMGDYDWRYDNLGLATGYVVDGATATTVSSDGSTL